MIIREIKESDALRFLELRKKLDEETQFMLLEAGERTTTVEEQRNIIRNVLSRDNQIVFVVESGERLVGFIGGYGGGFRRNKHTVYIVIGILQNFTGQGIGTRLFQKLEEWARSRKLHRLELTVMTHNKAAIALYRKMGFKIEGLKKHSLFVNGVYVDEYCMAKLLE
ncbi:GNAT family N-acetyltransferase [Thermosipho ferrireducens]|uniref:GNAT family N-acetyltransferase n=1 Tax=Thermosipho ferrireducens TaxID=2571116 RepID=A0ABX7S5R2_9BACT|nr:GNAT family protein [Thermosipho ferrireducens]QTA37903.1 GNAT family N-acetyltransferase [Thermosipho ferrireducens]